MTTSPYLQGVDYSDSYSSDFASLIYANDDKRFVILDAWGGISPFPAAANYTAASPYFGQNIAAYAEINLNNNSPNMNDVGAPKGTDQRGDLQIKEAFKALFPSGVPAPTPIAFMAVAAENDVGGLRTISQNAAVARCADAVWAVWTRGVPALIYTRPGFWGAPGVPGFPPAESVANNSDEISGASVPLWDARQTGPLSALDQSLQGNFTPYGDWQSRMGRQWDIDTDSNPVTLEEESVDLDVFDPRAFSLASPPIGCKPALFVSNLSLTRSSGGGLVLNGTVYNDARAYGTLSSYPPICDALAARITQATLLVPGLPPTSSFYSVEIPYKLKTIPAFSTTGASFAIGFSPSASIASGTLVDGQLSLSCGGGRFTFSFRNLTVP